MPDRARQAKLLALFKTLSGKDKTLILALLEAMVER
jgi:hypothetical protein